MKVRWLFAISLLALLVSPLSAQTTIAIKGAATLSSAVSEQTRASGTGFYYSSYIGDSLDSYGFCVSGQTCDGSAMTGASTIYVDYSQFPITHSRGCLLGVCSEQGYGGGVIGMLNVTYDFSFITPSTDQSFTLIAPITVTGSVSAPGGNGSLWTVDINAAGSAKLYADVSGGFLSFHVVDFRYVGQATATND